MGLFSQLAGGGNDEGAQFSARAFHQAFQNGQHEGGRFAGAGLGQAQNVTPFQNGRDGLGLNGGRSGITGRYDTRVDLRVQLKLVESHK